jgi:hypothetical protein
MASFDSINYSLRPNKSIERWLAFDGMRRLQSALELYRQVYVGMGSVWFSDFHMAHRILGVCDMVSFEANEIGFARAQFNRPFRTVRIKNEISNQGLPKLYLDDLVRDRPWIIWLDYDRALSEEALDDVRSAIENAPPNSLLLITFSATGNAYGKPKHRSVLLKSLLGGVVPDDMSLGQVDDKLPETLADLTRDFMISATSASARPGGFIPAFRLIYSDTATMVTVGGVLPTPGAAPAVKALVRNGEWPALVERRISTPHLTIKEAAVLRSQLPARRPMTRKTIQKLGFDLQDDQIASFQEFFRYYPSFAQVMS